MSNEIVDASFRPSEANLATSKPGLDVKAILAEADAFETIKSKLLDPSKHFNNISGKDRVNAAGWDVIANAFSITLEILSVASDGKPGARRELLTGANGKTHVSYSITLRAITRTGRFVDQTGRCDSTEAKHNQYEHKMEKVARTRAKSAAICELVGGASSDIAEDMDDMLKAAAKAKPIVRQVSVDDLKKLHGFAGSPDGSLGQWLSRNIPGFDGKKLTPDQSVRAEQLLMEAYA